MLGRVLHTKHLTGVCMFVCVCCSPVGRAGARGTVTTRLPRVLFTSAHACWAHVLFVNHCGCSNIISHPRKHKQSHTVVSVLTSDTQICEQILTSLPSSSCRNIWFSRFLLTVTHVIPVVNSFCWTHNPLLCVEGCVGKSVLWESRSDATGLQV